MKKGKLIVFEGIDGSGKSTQIELLKRYMSARLYPTTELSNVSASPVGKAVREVLSNKDYYINNRQVACVFLSELHIVVKDIKALLDNGINVICSRYYYSTLAYVGDTEEEFNDILVMCKFDVEPDFLIYLDVEPDVAFGRIKSRKGKEECYDDLAKLTKIKINFEKALSMINSETKLIRTDACKSVVDLFHDIISGLKAEGMFVKKL